MGPVWVDTSDVFAGPVCTNGRSTSFDDGCLSGVSIIAVGKSGLSGDSRRGDELSVVLLVPVGISEVLEDSRGGDGVSAVLLGPAGTSGVLESSGGGDGVSAVLLGPAGTSGVLEDSGGGDVVSGVLLGPAGTSDVLEDSGGGDGVSGVLLGPAETSEVVESSGWGDEVSDVLLGPAGTSGVPEGSGGRDTVSNVVLGLAGTSGVLESSGGGDGVSDVLLGSAGTSGEGSGEDERLSDLLSVSADESGLLVNFVGGSVALSPGNVWFVVVEASDASVGPFKMSGVLADSVNIEGVSDALSGPPGEPGMSVDVGTGNVSELVGDVWFVVIEASVKEPVVSVGPVEMSGVLEDV